MNESRIFYTPKGFLSGDYLLDPERNTHGPKLNKADAATVAALDVGDYIHVKGDVIIRVKDAKLEDERRTR